MKAILNVAIAVGIMGAVVNNVISLDGLATWAAKVTVGILSPSETTEKNASPLTPVGTP